MLGNGPKLKRHAGQSAVVHVHSGLVSLAKARVRCLKLVILAPSAFPGDSIGFTGAEQAYARHLAHPLAEGTSSLTVAT